MLSPSHIRKKLIPCPVDNFLSTPLWEESNYRLGTKSGKDDVSHKTVARLLYIEIYSKDQL